MMSVNSKTLFFVIFFFGLISSSNASELDNVAACSGVVIGNASVDFSLGDEGSFNDGIKLAITAYLGEVLEQSSAEEDIAIADQILAANTDKIINAANTETFDYDVYEQVVQCYRKVGGVLLKNSETILQNKEEIDGIILQRIELLKRVLSAG